MAFVPRLNHNLLSLQQFTASYYTYFGTNDDDEYRYRSSRTLRARKLNRANVLNVFLVPTNDRASAAIAPGVRPPNLNKDASTNDFHCSFGRVYEGNLRETAKQRNVNLTGELREYQG